MSLLLVSLLGRGVPCTRRSNYKLLHDVGRFLAASSSGSSAANLQSSHITAPAISVVVQRYLHTARRQPLSPLYRTGSRLAMSTTNNATSVAGESEGPQRRVLSIQSHVVHGYVGNKSASFPLQVLGFEVDAINSVQFSNHTGYKHIKGQVLDDTQLDDLVTGLELNNLLNVYSHLLTGYIGQDAFLRKVVDTVKKLRAQNPNLVYVCDPVMGDDGHMYVPANLLPIYRDEIIPLADICTPNQFEVELLTGERIASESDAWQAMQWFHERGVRTVALSSTDLGATGELLAFVSHRSGADDAKPLRLTMRIPKQGNGVVFTGTGDLFASLFLAHSTLQPNVKGAFESTVATLQAVIANTVARMPAGLVKVESRHRELKIVQSKCDIERPTVKLSASEV